MRDRREDPGQYYPGGRVVPKTPTGQGGGGTTDYSQLSNKPKINNHELTGNKTAAQLGLATPSDIPDVLGKLPLRPLPKYLHYLAFDDTYPADAAWLYDQLGPSDLGRCSAVRRGGKLWRNYDWTFDDAAEFVVRVPSSSSRFGSVGVASVGSRLTENDVMSAVNSRYYKCLPGMTLDGINDHGVVCEINVDGGPKTGWHGDAEDEGIHILAAVRWALDHGETAAQAAEWIADHIIQPTGEMNFHFMVADAEKTYVVENGAAHLTENDDQNVLTNFARYAEDFYGGGYERLILLQNGEDIKSVWFTNAYQIGNDWDSDFESAAQHAEAIRQWAAQGTDKEAHRGKTTSSGLPWWQSVHTTEYDFAAKTMKVAVQEQDDWYTFAVGQANVDLTPIEAQIAALQSGKRDKTDEACYKATGFTRFTWTSDDSECPEGWLETANSPNAPQPSFDNGLWDFIETPIGGYVPNEAVEGPEDAISIRFYLERVPSSEEGRFYAIATRSVSSSTEDPTHVLARRSATASSALARFDADGNLFADTDTEKEIAKKADEYSDEFIYNVALPLYRVVRWVESENGWAPVELDEGGGFTVVGTVKGDCSSRVLSWGQDESSFGVAFTATRKRVLRTGDAATPQEAAAKFDTSKAVPAYSASSTYEVGDLVLHDGAAYKCTTAIATAEAWTASHWTAATDSEIAARLNGLKADGSVTDKFATDLLGKQVAKEAIDNRTKASASAITGDALTLPDGGVVSASSSAPTITFGTARQDGLRFCELYITNPDTAADGAIVSISGKVYSDVSLTDLPKLDKGATYYFTFAEFKVTQETVEGETVSVSHWKVSKQKLDAMNGEITPPAAA